MSTFTFSSFVHEQLPKLSCQVKSALLLSRMKPKQQENYKTYYLWRPKAQVISFHCFPSPEQILSWGNFKLTNEKYQWTRTACSKTEIHHTKNIGINQLHVPRNPLCLDISSLIIYKQTSYVCSAQCRFISTLLQKIQIVVLAKSPKLKELRNNFQCDLMTNYSDGCIFRCCESIVVSHSETRVD